MKNNNSRPAVSKYDYVVVGAGGAGMCLLLALHTTKLVKTKRVLVLEPENKNSNDRTWCFWAKESDTIVKQLQPIIKSKWQFIDVFGKKKDIDPYSYYYLRSLDFYNFVKEKTIDDPNIDWHQQSVKGIIPEKDNNRILAEDGQEFTGKLIFSSIIQQHHKETLEEENRVLWQSFSGLIVKFESNCLQEDVIRLMDFDVEQDGHCQFIYLLPFSKNKALIEFTRFGKEIITENYAQKVLHNWITTKYGNYEIIEKERGKIPMTTIFNPEEPFHSLNQQIIPIGTAAGSVKCSTGYAFQSMFEHTLSIAEALQQSKSLPKPYHNSRFSFYDNLLLILLHEKPHLGKLIFERLFNKVQTVTILKFLQEKTRFAEDLRILMSLPIPPFLWSLFNRTKLNKKYNGQI
jgi:lycopene beta-cyclase